MESDDSKLRMLADRACRQWPALFEARRQASEVKGAIEAAIRSKHGGLGEDLDFVLFGSLARQEWTSGSDVDWAILIDGQSNPDHQATSRKIADILQTVTIGGEPLRTPGSTGVFGELVFSHELVHLVGGDTDSNHNLTRRMLLLLESCPAGIDGNSGTAWTRVIRQIVDRYINNANLFQNPEFDVPRFLLNDLIRFWRTMCVDFAWKEWEQGERKWAIRNVKLRMSRKLTFAAGLLNLLADKSWLNEGDKPIASEFWGMHNRFIHEMLGVGCSGVPASEVIAGICGKLNLDKYAGRLFDYYDAYLMLLNDPVKRRRLENLNQNQHSSDECFQEFRTISHRFQEVLEEIFFDSSISVRTRKYGLF